MKKAILIIIVSVCIVALAVFSLWAVLTGFGNDPFALLSEEILDGITVERADPPQKVVLSKRDCEVLLAVIDQVKFQKYTGELDEHKVLKSGLTVTLERKLLPDLQYYHATYYEDPKDPHNSSVSLLCVNGTYYTPAPESQENYRYLKMSQTASYMLPENRPKMLSGN